MPSMLRILIFSLIMLIGMIHIRDAYAQSSVKNFIEGCPQDVPTAQIRVLIEMFDPPVHHNYTIQELSRFSTGTQSPYPSHVMTHTYGITRNPLSFRSEMQIASAMNPLTKKKCYWYQSITLTMQTKPEIFMGKNIPPKGCYYNAVLTHELEHANIERRLLYDYQPIITKTLTDFVHNTGFIRNIDAGRDQQVYEHFNQALAHQIDTIHSHMEPVRRARQAQIDTAASYEATAASCRGKEKQPF
jgi:hypothetical protein